LLRWTVKLKAFAVSAADSGALRVAALCGIIVSPPDHNLQDSVMPVSTEKQLIRVGHSPDPDDAFMFYALAKDKIDTGGFRFEHELVDIETLNRRAFASELELTALSLHAYAYLSDKYLLCTCGASMGDNYGPMVVARETRSIGSLRGKTIAVPGTLTTAFLTLRMCLGPDFQHVVVPFDQILDVVAAGQYAGQPIDAGLIIHEGQLTYSEQNLHLVVDLGQWWMQETGLPLPLGANGIRKDLGEKVIREVNRLLKESIRYGLEHRQPALAYAQQFGRGLDDRKADTFVGMYVNDWTLDFGERGRQAVRQLLARGHAAGVIPKLVEPEFVA
jgi:1,4-dihydroxy-6-naphthoate synthase